VRRLVIVAFVLAAACSGRYAPSIRLVAADERTPAYVEVSGLDRETIQTLGRNAGSAEAWGRIFTVRVKSSVRDDQPPVVGKYAIQGRAVRFTPLFPLDPGREYDVTFDPSALMAGDQRRASIAATVALPRPPIGPATEVSHVYPSGDVVPENQLRMYIHFTGPMGRRGGMEYIELLDENGRKVEDPFLPLDTELWNADRTRYTVFFDPGRQKRGILPNRDMGPSLVIGRTYTLVVRREWTDAEGQPLKGTFTRRFRVGEPDLAALDYHAWTLDVPPGGTRAPLVVRFPKPLDHGLLLRALGVRQGSHAIGGDVRIDAGETRWSFTPRDPWHPGDYELFALSVLEDLAGNRIGRAFEVAGGRVAQASRTPEPESYALPFQIPSGRGD
jgi:hypothetical protein